MSARERLLGRDSRPLQKRGGVALALALSLAGCKSWHPVPAQVPERWIARETPPAVRLTAVTGTRVTIRNPIVVADSIVSASAPVAVGPFAPPRPGVLASDVHELEIARFDPVKTALLGAGFAAVSISWARTVGRHGGGKQIPEPPVLKLAPGLRFMWRVTP